MNTPVEWAAHIMQLLQRIPAHQFHRDASGILRSAAEQIQKQVIEEVFPGHHRRFSVPAVGKEGVLDCLHLSGPFPMDAESYDDLLKIMGMFKESLTIKPAVEAVEAKETVP